MCSSFTERKLEKPKKIFLNEFSSFSCSQYACVRWKFLCERKLERGMKKIIDEKKFLAFYRFSLDTFLFFFLYWQFPLVAIAAQCFCYPKRKGKIFVRWKKTLLICYPVINSKIKYFEEVSILFHNAK
jgi:hypothetical protein